LDWDTALRNWASPATAPDPLASEPPPATEPAAATGALPGAIEPMHAAGPVPAAATEPLPTRTGPVLRATGPVPAPEPVPTATAAEPVPGTAGPADRTSFRAERSRTSDPAGNPAVIDPGLAAAAATVSGRASRMPGPGMGGITEHGGILPPQTVRRIACDAGINRIVLGPSDVPINAGRRLRVVSAAQRRVVVARDGGCRFHGCDRPPAWSQVHHVVHWADGGPTDLPNLLSLCHHHHHRVHDEGWRLSFDGTTVTIHRPDGTILDPP